MEAEYKAPEEYMEPEAHEELEEFRENWGLLVRKDFKDQLVPQEFRHQRPPALLVRRVSQRKR